MGSYKIIVQVEGGKPTDHLVRYLKKDLPELELEYNTDLVTYYILPNITKHFLSKKIAFMERNKGMLGLIQFEVISMSAFEIAQRDILQVIPAEDRQDFGQSIELQEFGEVDVDFAVPMDSGARLMAEDLVSDRIKSKDMKKKKY